MSDNYPITDNGTLLAARPGWAAPSPATIRFVEQWLWNGDGRETVGLPWTDDYVRDAARMIEFVVIHRSPNAQSSATEASRE